MIDVYFRTSFFALTLLVTKSGIIILKKLTSKVSGVFLSRLNFMDGLICVRVLFFHSSIKQ
jgi:hypothetical protein